MIKTKRKEIMIFKDKAIELANGAKNKAENLSSELQQSQVLDKAKSKLSETKEAVENIDTSGIKLMNLFTVFSLSALLISTFFPVTSFMGRSAPLSELVPTWLYVVTLITLCSNLLGAKQILSRGLILFLVLAISFSVVDQISGMLKYTGMPRGDNVLRLLVDVVGIGFYLFLVSFVFVVISLLKPGYTANSEFWGRLIKK